MVVSGESVSLLGAPAPLPLCRQAIVKTNDADCQVAGQEYVCLLLLTVGSRRNSLKFEPLP